MGSCDGRGHTIHYREYALSSTLSMYSTMIAIVWRDCDAASLYHCWTLFIVWWGYWYANMSPSDKKSVWSLRWPLRPVGLLLEKLSWNKAGKLYEYTCNCVLKGWLSTVMDDAACGAHQGMRMQKERTPRIHRWMALQIGAQHGSTDEWSCVVLWIAYFLHNLCCMT